MSVSKIAEIYTLLKTTVTDLGIAENTSYEELIALKGTSTANQPMTIIKKNIVSKTYVNDIVLDHLLKSSTSIDASTSKRIRNCVSLIPKCFNNSMAIRSIFDFPNVFVSNAVVVTPCINDLEFLKKESPKVKAEFLIDLMVAVVEQLLKAGSLNIATKKLTEELKVRNSSTSTKGAPCEELNNNPILDKMLLTFINDKVAGIDLTTKPTVLKKMFSQAVFCQELLVFRIKLETTVPTDERFVHFIETMTSFVQSQLDSLDRSSFMQLCNKIYINVKLREFRLGSTNLSNDEFMFKMDGSPSVLTNEVIEFAKYTVFEEEINPKTNKPTKPTRKCITQFKQVFNVFGKLINLSSFVGLQMHDGAVERKFFGTVKYSTKISVKPAELDFVNKLMTTLLKYFLSARTTSTTPTIALLKHLVVKCNLTQKFSAATTPILAKLFNPFEELFAAITTDKACSIETAEKHKTWFKPSVKKPTTRRGSVDTASNGTEIVRLEDIAEESEISEDEVSDVNVSDDDLSETVPSESDMEDSSPKVVPKVVKKSVKKPVEEPVKEPVKKTLSKVVKAPVAKRVGKLPNTSDIRSAFAEDDE